MADKLEGGLTDAEQAYFESEGETSFETETENTAETTTEAAPAETVEKDGEPEAEAEADGKGERDEKGRFVNYGALHAERTKRQQLEQEVGSLKQFKAAMEERMRWFEAAATPQQQEDTPPDPNVDVFAALKWTQDKLLEQQKVAQEARQQQEQQTQEQQAEQQVWNYWQQDAATYTKENPDFGNAAKWLSDYRDKQLTAYSAVDQRFASPQARNAQIELELKDIVIRGAQSGRSPASIVYEIAKGYGYTAKQAEAVVAGKLELPDKLKNVEQAQQGSRTVGQASGARSGGDEVSIDSLAAMPQNEFNEWMKVPANEARFKKMMGG